MQKSLSDDDVAAIEQRVWHALAVAPPPWATWLETRHATGGGSFVQLGGGTDADNEMYLDVRLSQRQLVSPDPRLDAIVDLIGNTPEDILRLIAEIRRLRALVAVGGNPEAVARPTLHEMRQYHVSRLNEALRRPGMWGRELTIRMFMDAVAFVEGLEEVWRHEQEMLRTRGAFNALGVHGVVTELMPRYRDDGAAVASVYADIAWRHGWLTVDRTLPDAELRPLRDDPTSWCTRNRNLDDVLAALGPPSVRFGGGTPHFSKTLAYASADHSQRLVCLHFAGVYDWKAPSPQPTSPPTLVAIRYGDGPFHDTFTFTPAGVAYRDNTTDDDRAERRRR